MILGKYFRQLRNERGFTYVEAMLVSGLILILAYTGAQVLNTTSRATMSTDRRLAANAVAGKIAEALRYERTCTDALGPASGVPIQFNGTIPAERDVALHIKNIQAGPELNKEIIQGSNVTNPVGGSSADLPIARIRLNELKLTDAVDLDPNPDDDPATKQVLYSVRMSITDLNGENALKEKIVGSVILNVDTSGASWPVTSCVAPTVATLKPVCEGMGCTYDDAQMPPCRCLASVAVCATPGYFPVAFKSGVPDCRPLGGDTCPGTTFLVGVGIERNILLTARLRKSAAVAAVEVVYEASSLATREHDRSGTRNGACYWVAGWRWCKYRHESF
jgi:type II secretory pathway pseudopilin PulG